MRLCLVCCATLLLALPPLPAQDSTGKMAVPRQYSGPPGTIDGPETLPSGSQPWLDPSGSAVVLPDGMMPDGENAGPLTLPGDSVMEGLPPDHILVGPQEIVAPPQKISAYKDSFFQ